MEYREKPEEIHAKNLMVLKERIKQENVCGSYVFYGDEEYTKNHYYSVLCRSSGNDKLNTHTICDQEFSLADFMSAVSTNAVQSIDMFSDMEQEDSEQDSIRVVKLVNPDFSETSKKDMEFFVETLSELPEQCIVVFWFYEGQTDFLKKSAYNAICEKSLVVNFKREPVGSAVLITWILRHFSRAKINADRSVAVHLCTIVGNSMTNLKNEIDKCIEFLVFEKRDTLTIKDVDFICIKSVQAQTFEVSTGALSGNFVKAAAALKILHNQKVDPTFIMGAITKSVNDLCKVEKLLKQAKSTKEIAKITGVFDFVVNNYVNILNNRSRDFSGKDSLCKIASMLCFEYDTRIKMTNEDDYQLLSELVFKLSFAGRENN